ncbi:MAG: T9SS type A sorting domain-containing protein [Bacteroidales bacterium]|nr:T9SS type A sorting domain-containing protein [Bacteroidales bacterium]
MNKLLLPLALLILLSTKGYTQKPETDEDGNPVEYYEGFEGGAKPSGWLNEILHTTSGGVDLYWRYQTGGGFITDPNLKDPATAYKGTYNALFFTHDDQASTRLETPWWNMASDKPAVAFWLTQVSRTGTDALTIQYSIKQANGTYGPWIDLETFTTSQESWTRKIVALPDAVKGQNIKIGFVGELNFGLGICLDEVMIIDLSFKPRRISSVVLNHNSSVAPTQTSNNPVAMLETSVTGASDNLKLSQLSLTYTGTSISDISTLKLYLTRSSIFTTEKPITATYSPSGNNIQITVSNPASGPSIQTGLNYIWVCAGINGSAQHGNSIKFELPANGVTTNLYNSTSGELVETMQYPLQQQAPSGESTIEESLFFDEFDSGSAKWTLGPDIQMGAPTGIGTGDPLLPFTGSSILATNLSGNYLPNIPAGSNNYIATTQAINAKYYKNISVRLRRWLNIESKDKVGMWISTDNGTTWVKFYENILGIFDNYWTSQSFDISSEATRKEQVMIKLGIASSDGDDEKGGLNIENFAITGDYIAHDVGVESFISPTSGCSLGTDVDLKISLRNYGAEPVTGPFAVEYRINDGAWVSSTFNGTINVDASQEFTFAQGANLSEYGVKNISFRTVFSGDEDASNDIKSVALYSYPTITAPVTESFEVLLNHWYPYGTNSSWQWGAPTGTVINKAAQGTSAWVTKLNGTYNTNEFSYLESPCYNLPVGENYMVFSFMHMAALEAGMDGFTVQYSTDGGATWGVLPKHASYSDNWLPTSSIAALGLEGWSVNTTGYVMSKTLLPADAIAAGTVKFRFAFASNAANNFEGVALDLIRLYALTNDIGVSSLTSPITACEIGTSALKFKLKNFSPLKTYPAGSVPITFTVNDSEPTTESFTLASPLAPNGEVEVTTTATFNFDEGFTFNIAANTSLSDDDNKNNDKLETIIYVNGMPNYQIVGADMGTIGLVSIPPNHTLDAGAGYDSYNWESWNGSAWISLASTQTVTISAFGKYRVTVDKGVCSKTAEVDVIQSDVDVMVESFTGLTDACLHTTAEKPSASIKNNGTATLAQGTVIPVAININDTEEVIENLTVPAGGLAAGSTLSHTFTTGIDLSLANAYPIKIGTRYAGDINYSNDFTAEQIINTWGAPTVHIKAYHKTNIGVNPVDVEQGTILKSLQPDTISLDAGTGYAAYKWERKLFGFSTWSEIGTTQLITIDQNNSADYRLTATTMHSCGDVTVEFAINAKDLGIASIEGLNEDYCQTEEGVAFNVIIQNYGLDTYLGGTEINLVFNTPIGIQNKTVILEAGSPLTSGNILSVPIPSPIKLGVGLNPIRVSTAMDDDCVPENDSYDLSVMVKASPTVSIVPDVIKSVFNSSSELPINPNYSDDCTSYSWTNGATTRNIVIYGIPNSEYSVTTWNNDGCSASAKVTIVSTDISVSSLISPMSKCSLNDNTPQAQVTITNSGSIDFATGTTINLKIYVDNVLVTNGEENLVLASMLAAGESVPFTFTNVDIQAALLGKNTADIKVEATLMGFEDINPANNVLTNTIVSTGYPTITLGGDKNVHAWTQLLSANPDPGYPSYSWSYAPSGTTDFVAVGSDATYTASQETGGKGSGIYKLVVADAYGCPGEATANITFYVDDMEVTKIINPASGCGKTATEAITINLKNNSSWDLPAGTNYQLGVKIGTGTEIIEGHALSATMAQGASIEKTLTNTASIASGTTLTSNDITVRAILPTDMTPSNDSKTKTVESYPRVTVELEYGNDNVEYTTPNYTLDASGYASVEWTLTNGLVLVEGTLTSETIKVSGSGDACVKAFNTWGCYGEDCVHLVYMKPDLSITEIVNPTGGCNQTANETISVIIKNVGNSTFPSNDYIQVSLKDVDPDNMETTVEGNFTLDQSLAPNETVTRTFDNRINLTKPGTHQLTATVTHTSDENTSNNSIEKSIVTFPTVTVNLGANKEICEGTTTVLDAGLTDVQSYAWEKDGQPLSETTKTITVSEGGTYTVTVTDNNGCTGSSSITITLKPAPVVNLGPDRVITEPITLDAGAGHASYLWQDGSTNQTFTVEATGLYSVTVTAANGCTGYDEVSITLGESVKVPVTAVVSPATPLCYKASSPSQTITLEMTNQGTRTFNQDEQINIKYRIGSNPEITEVHTFSSSVAPNDKFQHTFNNKETMSPGTYTFTCLTIFSGTSSTISTFEINIHPSPTFSFAEDTIRTTLPYVIQSGVGDVDYLWNTGSTSPSISVTQVGKYWLRVTNDYQCSASDTVVIWWAVSAQTIAGINATIKLFPNPVKDKLNVQIESGKTAHYTLELINPQGMIVTKRQTIKSDNITEILEVNSLSPGIYLLRITSENQSAVFRIIVQ